MRSTTSSLSGLALAALLASCSPSGATPANDQAREATQAAPNLQDSRAVSAAEEAEEMRNASNVLEFPAAFRGTWDYQQDGCAKAESGTRFTISDAVIKGYESQEKLLSIRQLTNDEIRVTLELESANGDGTYDQVMALSPVEGVSMRIDTADGETVRAYRCDRV